MRSVLPSLLTWACVAWVVAAQQPPGAHGYDQKPVAASPAPVPGPTPPPGCTAGTLGARGQKTVYTRPDLATIDLTITGTAPSAVAAREVAAATSQAILTAVESVDGVGRGGMVSSTWGGAIQADAGGGGGRGALPTVWQGFVLSVRDPEGGHSEGGGFEGAVSRALGAAIGAANNASTSASTPSSSNATAALRLSGVRASLSPAHAAEAQAAARAGAIKDMKATAARDAAALGVSLGGLASFSRPHFVSGTPSAAASVNDALGAGSAATPKLATAGLPPPSTSPTPVVLGDVPTEASVEGTFWVCNGRRGDGEEVEGLEEAV